MGSAWRPLSVGLGVVLCAVAAHAFVLVSSPATTAGSSGAAVRGAATAATFLEALDGGQRFGLETSVLLNDVSSPRPSSEVGFRLTADVSAAVAWTDPSDDKRCLLWLQVSEAQLHIASRTQRDGAHSGNSFVQHSSPLSDVPVGAFAALWEGGAVPHVFLARAQDASRANLQRAIASLFQFKVESWEGIEKDVSGRCHVSYRRLNDTTVLKEKTDCSISKQVPHRVHPDPMLAAEVESDRSTWMVLAAGGGRLDAVTAVEEHSLRAAARREAASVVRATLRLQRTGAVKAESAVKTVEAETLEEALSELANRHGVELQRSLLVAEIEAPTCGDGADCPTFSKLVKEHKEALSSAQLGSLRSAAALTKLVAAARRASRDELLKALKNPKNKPILTQLCDIVGAAQTAAAHEAAMKALHLESDEDFPAAERYLQALSLGAHPLPHVVKDVLRRSDLPGSNPKLQETLMLTAAALANRLHQLPSHSNHKVVNETRESLLAALERCGGGGAEATACRLRLVRALRNLAAEETAPALLALAADGGRVAAAALRALRALPRAAWTSAEAQAAAERVFFQRTPRRADSSARTLALDLLLEADTDENRLQDLFHSLLHDDAFEIRRYAWERLQQLSEERAALRRAAEEALRAPALRTWHARALRGVSTALTRVLMRHPSANASLSTVQEAAGGLLKRGSVDVVLQRDGASRVLFSLGLFAGGLGSFLSSSSDQEEAAEDAAVEATAGMDLTVLGVALRPFVFFSGQGELMGHVWSGTASERTPAFQVMTLLQDHQQSVPLQTGQVAELTLTGAVSFDLAGQIQLSIWNRNAHALVEKNVALLLQGGIHIDTSFVRSHVEFNIATEPRLNLSADINFYDKVALCLQLSQPNAEIRQNTYKVERIPGSKHRLRKSKYQIYSVPGKTYSLNHKNNDMCRILFSENQ